MIGLTLIACHMLGDFVLANRWMAAKKLTDWRWRTRHVTVYLFPFVPVAVVLAPSGVRAAGFLAGVAALHWLTDCRRFRSTLGDWIAWQFCDHPIEDRREVTPGVWTAPLPPNPWEPIPLLIDQSLHIVQLAALGWLLT